MAPTRLADLRPVGRNRADAERARRVFVVRAEVADQGVAGVNVVIHLQVDGLLGGIGVAAGATVNTGTLAPGGTREYFLRATVPSAGVSVGDEDRIRLTGVSLRNSLVSDTSTDQLTVISGTNGNVQILPDTDG